MEFVSDLKKQEPKPVITQVKYDKAGNQSDSNLYYAEEIISNSGTSYFIKTYASMLFDPYGANSNREQSIELKIKRVSYDTFKSYIEYLRTRNLKFLSIAQRGFINDRA